MNWRRGVLLAALNLVVALAMIVVVNARDARTIRASESRNVAPDSDAPLQPAELHNASPAELVRAQEASETVTVTVDLCTVFVGNSVQEQTVLMGNLPAVVLAGWRLECPPQWSLAGRIFGTSDFVFNRQHLALQRKVDVGLCVLIVLQWFLIGSFPLTRPRRPWQEPGAFITTCTLIAAALTTNHLTEDLARLPVLLAGIVWYWWAGLLIWRGIRLAWRTVMKLWKTPAAV